MRGVRTHHVSGLIELGSSYGSWIMPGDVIDPSWTCYLVGAGGDVSIDLELVARYGVIARSFDPVLDYVERAERDGRDEPRFSAHHAAITTTDGPVRLQITHDTHSQSVSGAHLYDSHSFIEAPGRRLSSVMAELGDERIDLLKIDVEGMELEVLAGARQTIARCLPIIVVERLKTDQDALIAVLGPNGYRLYHQGLNIIAIHPADPSLERIIIVPER